jgi:hypothetical protein
MTRHFLLHGHYPDKFIRAERATPHCSSGTWGKVPATDDSIAIGADANDAMQVGQIAAGFSPASHPWAHSHHVIGSRRVQSLDSVADRAGEVCVMAAIGV